MNIAFEKMKETYKTQEYKDEEREIRAEELKQDTDEILKLQSINEGVTVRSREVIKDLLFKKLMYIARNDKGEIIACFYKEPLVSQEAIESGAQQIFRIGGSSMAKTMEAQKAFMKLVKKQMEDEGEKIKAITKTEKETSMGKFLEKNGWIKQNFEECEKNYPDFLEAYLNKSSKPKEEYLDAEFYILLGGKE